MLTPQQIVFMEKERQKLAALPKTPAPPPPPEAGRKPECKIPTIRANKQDIRLILSVYAAAKELGKVEKDMERRVRAIPRGWANLRMAKTLLDKLADSLVLTLPYEKLTGMLKMLPHMHYSIAFGDQAAREPDTSVVDNDDLDVLLFAAHEKCRICIDGDCRKCALGRTLDKVLTYDRDGTPWSCVDLEEVEK